MIRQQRLDLPPQGVVTGAVDVEEPGPGGAAQAARLEQDFLESAVA
jgi:hypothetical protein